MDTIVSDFAAAIAAATTTAEVEEISAAVAGWKERTLSYPLRIALLSAKQARLKELYIPSVSVPAGLPLGRYVFRGRNFVKRALPSGEGLSSNTRTTKGGDWVVEVRVTSPAGLSALRDCPAWKRGFSHALANDLIAVNGQSARDFMRTF